MTLPTRNIVVDRLHARLEAAADTIREAMDSTEDRECLTLNEINDLKFEMGRASRSLDLCNLVLNHMERDLLTPGGVSAEMIDARNTEQVEAAMLNVIHETLKNGKAP